MPNNDGLAFDTPELVRLAAETLDWSNAEIRRRAEEATVTQYLRLEKVLGPKALVWKVAESVRIPCVVEKVSFEESSQRHVVTFTATHRPEGELPEAESIRTPRCDSGRGKMYADILGRFAPGDKALIYKSHEAGKDGRKYRLLTWMEPLD